jgi:hypothetical protein
MAVVLVFGFSYSAIGVGCGRYGRSVGAAGCEVREHCMNWRRIVAMVTLLAPGVATAAGVEDFFGDWRGVELSIDGAENLPDLAPADLDMAIADHGDGFRIEAVALARDAEGVLEPRRFEAAFAPTGTPGVFAFEPGGGSLLTSLFADPAEGNPLKGDTLLWARLVDDALHVYSLAIDDQGGFALEHSTARLTPTGMDMRYLLRLENERIVTIEGHLARAGD